MSDADICERAGVRAEELAAAIAPLLREISEGFQNDVRIMLIVRPAGRDDEVGFCIGDESLERAIATLEHYRTLLGGRMQ